MLTSLFGAIDARAIGAALPATSAAASDAAANADTASFDTQAADTPGEGFAPSETALDVVVDASPAQAMRAHFAAQRSDLDRASARITLLDPSRLWAAQVIRALADAAGQPVERLNLRERATLRTLAVIERTTVPRRGMSPLKVYHADIRSHGLDEQEIGNALAERSHLTAVIVGAMQPQAVHVLLRALVTATRQPEWQCPWLVFLLPPGAPALHQRVLEQDWPAHVRCAAVPEAHCGSHTVWNAVLSAWEASAQSALRAGTAFDAGNDLPSASMALVGHHAAAEGTPNAQALARTLAPLASAEGLLACGLVDLWRGELLASDARPGSADSLAPLVRSLCAARRAAGQAAPARTPPPDEWLVTSGTEQTLLRTLPHHGRLAFIARIDRSQANLALLRFRLLDAEKHLF